MRSVTACIWLCIIGYQATALAQSHIPYATAGSIYTQNFDGLPNAGSFTLTGKGPMNLSGPPVNAATLNGWQFLMNGGTNTNAVFAVSTGSSTGNGVYSLGSSGATDRAMGSLSSGSGIYSIGLVFTNTTGAPLNSFTINFTTEQWRKGGSGNKNTWAFRYKTGVLNGLDQTLLSDEPNLDMVSVITSAGAASLNGNLPENQIAVSFTVRGINWKTGEQLLLRWDDVDEAGNDDVCGIDNFSFSATLISAAPTVITNPPANISSSGAVLNASVNDNFSATTPYFEYDTSNTFSNPVTVITTPLTIAAGDGNTSVSATLSSLKPGRAYFFRAKAVNAAGNTGGAIMSFTTALNLPVVTTRLPAGVATSTAVLGGTISSDGGSAITDRGIVWALSTNPTLLNNKLSMGNDTGQFIQTVASLPQGSTIYTKAYATSAAGTAYGSNESFTTQTMVLSLVAVSASLTNTSAVGFTFKTEQNITGLGSSNFAVAPGTTSGTAIKTITGSGNSYTITVATGNGSGLISLTLVNDNGITPSINNKPYSANSFYIIDKTPPVIRSVNIPNTPMKIGDTIPVTILVVPDADNYKMVTGNINSLGLTGFAKKNDSVYTASFVIANGTSDVEAANSIPLNVSLTDTIGNTSALFQSPITQTSDPIDANKPFIKSMTVPADGLYKAGDTLDFVFRFNEKIIVTTTAATGSFSVTVGTRVRTALLTWGSGTDTLCFRYIIQNGESDKDGIKFSSPLTLMNTVIKDLVGNTGLLTFTNPPVTKNIIVDAVVPVISNIITPAAAVYKTGNILDFLINFSKKVRVTFYGTPPSLPLIIGSRQQAAEYVSGSGSSSLLFRYIVQAGDMDKDGIKLPLPLNVDAATILDDAGNHASLLLNNIGALSNIVVNPVTAAVDKIILPPAKVYATRDTLEFTVGYTEKVFVNANPSLKLTIGTASKHAIYQSGSGSNALLFVYAVQPGDEDTNGIKLNSTLSLNNGSINDEKGNAVPLSLNAIPATSAILIDAIPPSVKNVAVPAKKTYTQGDTLDFTINFSEPVNVSIHTDTPYIKLLTGTVFKQLNYVGGSGSTALLFRYLVQKNDLDKNGIRLDSSITFSPTGITDLPGNPAILNLKNIASLSGIKIDAVAPSFLISGIAATAACENAPAFLISEMLAIKDEEINETVTWRVIGGPDHGTVSKMLFNSQSNGDRLLPANILYKPFTAYSGQDTMVVDITDGVNTARKNITLSIQPAIKNNSIGPSQIICTNNFPVTISGTAASGGDGLYQWSWEYASGTDSTSFSKATGSSDQRHYSPAQLSSTTWFRRKVISGECSDVSPASQVMVLKTGLWTGSTNSDWNNANNWCNGTIPGRETDVFILGNSLHEPVIKDTAWCNQLTIFNKTHIIQNGVLAVKANIIATPGAVDAREGTVIYNGITPQTIVPGSFADRSVKNLVINNPGNVSLQDDLFITGTVLLNSGSLITNDHLTLRHTATIGPSATGTAITGNTRVEHFIKGGKRAFRLLGHPFAINTGLDMIRDSIDISGDGGALNGFTNTNTNQPSAFRYDPFTGNDSAGIDAGWAAFTSINSQGENSWKEFSGIRLFVRGRPGQGLDATPAGDGKNGTYFPQAVTIFMSGPVHTGNQEIVLPKTKNRSYQVIANPYPSPVDLSLITRGNNISPNYWVWNPLQGVNGGYSSIPFKSKFILPPFGAFIVKMSGDTNNNLLFTENCKAKEPAIDSIPLLANYDDYFVELRLETDSVFWDRLLLLAIDSARSNADKLDAEKFFNPEINFYSLSRDQKKLSIDARPINNESNIPLGLQTNAGGAFSLSVAKLLLPSSNTLQLHDKYLNRWMKLEKDSSYNFTVTADTATQGNERFEISSIKLPAFVPSITMTSNLSPVPATDKVIISYRSPEKGNTSIRFSTLNGIIVKTIKLGYQKEGQLTIPVSDMFKGIYVVEIRCGNNINTQKMIKK